MKILYLHQYFKTPKEGGAVRSYYIAKALADAGHDVHLITSWNDASYACHIIDGITVHYLANKYDNKMNYIRRVMSFLRFAFKTRKFINDLGAFDLCYATSTPLTIGWLAMNLKKRKKIPYIFEVRDLWPEAPIQLGVFKNILIKRWLYRLEHRIYLNADKIIGLSPGITNYIRNLVPFKPLYTIPNIADCDFFDPDVTDTAFASKYGLQGRFVVTYTGAVGRINELESFLAIAARTQDEKMEDVVFVINGKGSEWKRLHLLAAKMKLENVLFLPFGDKNMVRSLLSVTSLAYVSFKPLEVLETSSPNKLFDAMAAGVPCVVNVQGWLKELVEHKNIGFYADQEDPQAFLEHVKGLREKPEQLLIYRENARKAAEAYFSRRMLTARIVDIIEGEEGPSTTTALAYNVTG